MKNDSTKKRHHLQFYPAYFTFPALAIFVLFFAVPVLAGFVLSFTDWNIMRIFEPKFNGLDNFIYLFTDDNFLLAIKNTIFFAVFTCVGIIVIGFLLAFALIQKLYARNFYRTVFYMPAVLSLIVVGIMFSSVFRMDGILNRTLEAIGLASWCKDWLGDPTTAMLCIIFVQIWKWSGFSMAIFIAGLQGISREYYEAATIDGANFWQQLRGITLPLLTPSFTIVITMNLIGALKVFEQLYVMTGGGPGYATQVLGTYTYQAFSKGLLGRSTAMGLVLFVIVTCASLLVNNILRKKRWNCNAQEERSLRKNCAYCHYRNCVPDYFCANDDYGIWLLQIRCGSTAVSPHFSDRVAF